jgi:hypothetical protein
MSVSQWAVRVGFAAIVVVVALGTPEIAWAQGQVGKRFLPTTLAVDDPFVADELVLPSIVYRPGRTEQGRTRSQTDIGGEFFKRITPRLGAALAGDLVDRHLEGHPSTTGFENLTVQLKYEIFRTEPHEAVFAAALGWEVGGTGRTAVGAQSFDTVTPVFLVGKGLGDLPEPLRLVRPLALTGALGLEIPTTRRSGPADATGSARHAAARTLLAGLVLEYSLPYLESFVTDLDLPRPFDSLIPVVELALETPVERRSAGKTTGTVNPGLIWDGDRVQVAVELVLPINDRTGKSVGVRAQLAFFLDRLLPRTLGAPLFGGR